MSTLDGLCREDLARSWNCGVAWFLMTSVLYYRDDVSVISDSLFDEMCHGLLDHWDTVRHPHKRFITRAMLVAGTGHNLNWRRLPLRVHGGASWLKQEFVRCGCL